ncbi:hypothetical protein MRX96_031223 [Rhipicephalus microplus]
MRLRKRVNGALDSVSSLVLPTAWLPPLRSFSEDALVPVRTSSSCTWFPRGNKAEKSGRRAGTRVRGAYTPNEGRSSFAPKASSTVVREVFDPPRGLVSDADLGGLGKTSLRGTAVVAAGTAFFRATHTECL